MASKKLKLGIFGFGCVGQGLYDVLRHAAVQAEIVRICVRDRHKSRPLPTHLFTFDREDILADPEVNVVVELTNDPDAAFEIVSTALRRGKAVVTANKKMLAEHFEELYALQAETGQPLLYEGAACAAIPIFRNLEEYYDNDLLTRIEGIFNGSTNYILSKIQREQLSYGQALTEAQALGFAETDPTLDVEAYDPRYKLSLLITHAFGTVIAPEQILRFGIAQASEPEFRFARERGLRLRLVAQARKEGEAIHAAVLPRFVDQDHPLYRVEDEFNAVVLQGAFSEQQIFIGKGAGSHPTGSAVLSDISALSYGYRYEFKKLAAAPPLYAADDYVLRVYLRYRRSETLAQCPFETIYESYKGPAAGYVTGEILASSLRRFLESGAAADVFVAELPERVAETRELLVPVRG